MLKSRDVILKDLTPAMSVPVKYATKGYRCARLRARKTVTDNAGN